MSEGEALDLSAAVPVDSSVLEIKYPGIDPPKLTGWKIELAGPGHPKTVALSAEISREQLRKLNAIEKAQVNGKKYQPDDESAGERAQRNVTRLVQRIINWSPDPVFKTVSDKPITFSEKAAVDLLLRPDMGWVLEQIADYLRSDVAFTQASAKT